MTKETHCVIMQLMRTTFEVMREELFRAWPALQTRMDTAESSQYSKFVGKGRGIAVWQLFQDVDVEEIPSGNPPSTWMSYFKSGPTRMVIDELVHCILPGTWIPKEAAFWKTDRDPHKRRLWRSKLFVRNDVNQFFWQSGTAEQVMQNFRRQVSAEITAQFLQQFAELCEWLQYGQTRPASHT